ncbi:dihydropteroate synthase [Shewanella sp. C32]|uniref:Dihydropteroate synthase n=1 Tax=Shewanella electrica TaxID=515560 RepID=A0ABT2FIP8_9GAMM|nr:dihydropteroate synthase [Shewanella electrica]MCH1924312.1 dihydropteroate synthase [Shewanella electrica]MCS4556214.1 dihydropteroate synthase [Shewanella electrica]
MFTLKSGNKQLLLDSPKVMGILNVTPDSFSDGGRYSQFDLARKHADEMIAAGVDFIDIGGESTRPGAAEVSLDEELHRVLPMVEYIANNSNVWISVDTSKAQVMTESVALGAHLINDVRSLTEPGALAAAVAAQVPVCIMHMQGQPQTMQQAPLYDNVTDEVLGFCRTRTDECVAAGLSKEQILLDPGFGFGKTLAHNYRLLAELNRFHELGQPLLVGLSRKSMIGNLLNRPVTERMAGSLAGAMIAAQQGAHIIRVHDVNETLDVLKVLAAVKTAN